MKQHDPSVLSDDQSIEQGEITPQAKMVVNEELEQRSEDTEDEKLDLQGLETKIRIRKGRMRELDTLIAVVEQNLETIQKELQVQGKLVTLLSEKRQISEKVKKEIELQLKQTVKFSEEKNLHIKALEAELLAIKQQQQQNEVENKG